MRVGVCRILIWVVSGVSSGCCSLVVGGLELCTFLVQYIIPSVKLLYGSF